LTGPVPLIPVILSGGAGSRLWPTSRSLYPKQLLPLSSDKTMIQETALRAQNAGFGRPLVICSEFHRFIVAEQLLEAGVMPLRLILEPMGRNTAPACIAAAQLLVASDPNSIMAVLPSDHVVADEGAFRTAMAVAVRAAEAGHLVTFGMRPTAPETGYGYILQGAALTDGAFKAARFIEKPDRERAAAMVAQPGYHWNSGMFVFRAATFLAEARLLCPDLHDGAVAAVAAAKQETDFLRLDKDLFGRTPSASIDYAVMEHTDKAAVVPADFGWSDVGSWSALWDISAKDAHGNCAIGDVLEVDCHDSYLRGDGTLVAGIGLSGVVVVATEDAVLIADKNRVQDVRTVVERLRASKRTEGDLHRKVYRPWGYYNSIDSGNRFLARQIMLRPGAVVSLQMHHHRAEHWIVVEGTARVTSGDQTFLLHENESTHIPAGTKHRLENPGRMPLRIIEVQSGAYLGEDDVVRYEDSYGCV
jgi:mannose-1-phosphate guanylyltransferase/mannose-6-phosphate isomerase